MDVFLRSSTFDIGKRDKERLVLAGGKQEIAEKHFAVGGGGTNTAVGLARLGWRTACVARFGQDWAGRWIRSRLEEEKADWSYLQQMKREATDYSTILLSDQGERIILVHRGPTRLNREVFPTELLDKTKWLYIASLEGNTKLLSYLVEKAADNGVGIVFNPGQRELEQKKALLPLLDKVTAFQINEEEARLLGGEDYWPFLQDCGVRRTVVVTKGKQGVEFFVKGERRKLPVVPAETVDATGAGDAFGVGLSHGLMADQSLSAAVKTGLTEAAAVVGKIGAKAGLLTRPELEQQLT